MHFYSRQLSVTVIFCIFWMSPSNCEYFSPVANDALYQVPVSYQYSWKVKDTKSGNDYRQEETRDGHITTGLYQVVLPGGQRQTVNYRVDKDSGFMADISYQGDSNYFTFQSNYQPEKKMNPLDELSYTLSAPSNPSYPSYSPSFQHQQQNTPQVSSPFRKNKFSPSSNLPEETQNEYKSHYRTQTQNYHIPEVKTHSFKDTPYQHSYPHGKNEQRDYYYPGFSSSSAYSTIRANIDTFIVTEVPTTGVTKEGVVKSTTTDASSSVTYEIKPDYSVPMYPIYLGDVYSARAKAGKSIPAQAASDYAVDEAGTTYIKPSPSYFAPERLGTYEIKHRKATARKPFQSDYQTPDVIIQV